MSSEDNSNASEVNPIKKPSNVQANEDILAAFEANFLGQLEQLTSRVDVLEKERLEMKFELTSASETAEKLAATLASTIETLKRVHDERNVVVHALEVLKAEIASKISGPTTAKGIECSVSVPMQEESETIGEIVQGLVERTVNDANATHADNSDNSPNPLAPNVTLPTPVIPPSTPRDGDSPSASEGDKAKSLSEKDIKNKAKKQQKTADKKRLAVAAKAAENAEKVKRTSLKDKLDRMVKSYMLLNAGFESSTKMEGFDEGKAKQFLAQRLHFHEQNNVELSLLASVMADNMCPLMLEYSKKHFDLEKSPDKVFDAEMDLLATLKMHSYSKDVHDLFMSGNVESTQKYIENFVENYKINQTEVRAGRAKFYGDVNSKWLCETIVLNVKQVTLEHLNWAESKNFFENAFAVYKGERAPDSEPIGYVELLFAELVKQEHPVLMFDGYFLPVFIATNPNGISWVMDTYAKMATSICTL